MKGVWIICLFGILAASGCAPEVGECDPLAAERLVYMDQNRHPYYAGQALMQRSCGAGVYCHSEGALVRYAAPGHLNYDLSLVSGWEKTDPESSNAEQTERLRRARDRAVEDARAIYHELVDGRMPPDGITDQLLTTAPTFNDLPAVGTPEATEEIRNWLACGAPVVERIWPDRPLDAAPVGSIIPKRPLSDGADCVAEESLCDSDCANLEVDPDHCGDCAISCASMEVCVTGTCLPAGANGPSWSTDVEPIFLRLVNAADPTSPTTCGGLSCHGPGDRPPALTEGDIRGALLAYVSTAGGPLVVPGDPEGSYLLAKVRGDADITGSQMPPTADKLTATDLALIVGWIVAGAQDN